MIKKEDVVDFDISPEYSTTGTVTDIVEQHTGEEGRGYNQYVVEEDGTIWTLHRDQIKGVVGPDKPAFDEYERAMRGI